MFNLKQQGIASIFVVLILLIGIVAGVVLIRNPQIFKSKAYENGQVIFVDDFKKTFPENITRNTFVHLEVKPPAWKSQPSEDYQYPVILRVSLDKSKLDKDAVCEITGDPLINCQEIAINNPIEKIYLSWVLPSKSGEYEIHTRFFSNQHNTKDLSAYIIYKDTSEVNFEIPAIFVGLQSFISSIFDFFRRVPGAAGINATALFISHVYSAGEQIITFSQAQQLGFNVDFTLSENGEIEFLYNQDQLSKLNIALEFFPESDTITGEPRLVILPKANPTDLEDTLQASLETALGETGGKLAGYIIKRGVTKIADTTGLKVIKSKIKISQENAAPLFKNIYKGSIPDIIGETERSLTPNRIEELLKEAVDNGLEITNTTEFTIVIIKNGKLRMNIRPNDMLKPETKLHELGHVQQFLEIIRAGVDLENIGDLPIAAREYGEIVSISLEKRFLEETNIAGSNDQAIAVKEFFLNYHLDNLEKAGYTVSDSVKSNINNLSPDTLRDLNKKIISYYFSAAVIGGASLTNMESCCSFIETDIEPTASNLPTLNPATKKCGTPPNPYPQCGAGSGSCRNHPDSINSNHTVLVTPAYNNACDLVYDCEDRGIIARECGNAAAPSASKTLTGWFCSGNSIFERYSDNSTKKSCQCGSNSGDCSGGTAATACRSKTPPSPYTEDAECYVPASEPALYLTGWKCASSSQMNKIYSNNSEYYDCVCGDGSTDCGNDPNTTCQPKDPTSPYTQDAECR